MPAGPGTLSQWTPELASGPEGLTLPAQVNYVGKAASLYDSGYALHGSAFVAIKYVDNTWMWDRVRVQGGAYGGMALFDNYSVVLAFLSYRDPNLLGTLQTYDATRWFGAEATGRILAILGEAPAKPTAIQERLRTLVEHAPEAIVRFSTPRRVVSSTATANPRPVVVDIWAPWSMPCRMIEPAMEKLGHEYDERVDVWKIYADEHGSLVQSLGVRGITTLIAYHAGQEVARSSGAQPQASLARLFEAAVQGEVPPKRGLLRNDRIIRLAARFGLLGVGLYIGFTWWLVGLAAIVLFSAVYDRCPIWRVVSSRLGQLLHPERSST